MSTEVGGHALANPQPAVTEGVPNEAGAWIEKAVDEGSFAE